MILAQSVHIIEHCGTSAAITRQFYWCARDHYRGRIHSEWTLGLQQLAIWGAIGNELEEGSSWHCIKKDNVLSETLIGDFSFFLSFFYVIQVQFQGWQLCRPIPAFTLGPVCRDFPRQSHSVDARRNFSRWSHQTCWVRGWKSDLGLVIDIAQLFSSNVRSRDCPRKVGAFDDSVDGRS